MAWPPAARESDILISPRVHARICAIAWRGRGSDGCTDSKRCSTCSAHAAAHSATSRWSESVSVPPRRTVTKRGSRSLGRITTPTVRRGAIRSTYLLGGRQSWGEQLMRHRRRLAATVVFVLVLAGLGAATPSQAQTSGRTFSVDPSTDLVDGQSVQYTGS